MVAQLLVLRPRQGPPTCQEVLQWAAQQSLPHAPYATHPACGDQISAQADLSAHVLIKAPHVPSGSNVWHGMGRVREGPRNPWDACLKDHTQATCIPSHQTQRATSSPHGQGYPQHAQHARPDAAAPKLDVTHSSMVTRWLHGHGPLHQAMQQQGLKQQVAWAYQPADTGRPIPSFGCVQEQGMLDPHLTMKASTCDMHQRAVDPSSMHHLGHAWHSGTQQQQHCPGHGSSEAVTNEGVTFKLSVAGPSNGSTWSAGPAVAANVKWAQSDTSIQAAGASVGGHACHSQAGKPQVGKARGSAANCGEDQPSGTAAAIKAPRKRKQPAQPAGVEAAGSPTKRRHGNSKQSGIPATGAGSAGTPAPAPALTSRQSGGKAQASKEAKALAALQDLGEQLELSAGTGAAAGHRDASQKLVVDCSTVAGLAQLQQQLAEAEAALMAVQYQCSAAVPGVERQVQQYYNSAQPGPSKAQRDKLRKACLLLRKLQGGQNATAQTEGGLQVVDAEEGSAASWDTCAIGLGVMCIPPATKQLHAAAPPLFHIPFPSTRTSVSTSTPAIDTLLHLLRGSQQKHGSIQQPCSAQKGRPLLVAVDSKALMRELLQAGVLLGTPPYSLPLMDPCIMGWLAEPHLVHRDEKVSAAGSKDTLTSYHLCDLLDRYGIKAEGSASVQMGGAVAAGAHNMAGTDHVNQGTNNAGNGSVQGASVGGEGVLEAAGPLMRLRHSLLGCKALLSLLVGRLQGWLPPATVDLEMKVSLILGAMESRGVGLSQTLLASHAQRVQSRMQALRTAAADIAGQDFNPGSSVQLAHVLYESLKLPLPKNTGRSSSKTHASTDEAALEQLSAVSPLPALILDYRCMQNLLTKWLRPPWAMQAVRAAQAAGGNAFPRVFCSWNALATATGRLSSSSPNLQAVTKYTVQTSSGMRALGRTSGAAASAANPTAVTSTSVAKGPAKAQGEEDMAVQPDVINVRDAFVAAPGCMLISADYSQIELRVLAHLSGDMHLTQLMCQAGLQGDVFQLIAASWLKQSGNTSAARKALMGGAEWLSVTAEEREMAKRIVYGIVYGLTPYGLQQQLSGYGVDVPRAQQLINSFLAHFSGVKAFIDRCHVAAQSQGYITTLMGRRRPLPGLTSSDPKVRQDTQRKVVNSCVQGSAADLIKLAMLQWEAWCAANYPLHSNNYATHGDNSLLAHGPGARVVKQASLNMSQLPVGLPAKQQQCELVTPQLVAQIHDELLIECDARPDSVATVAGALQSIMCDVMKLQVPLIVNVYVGQSWGTMTKMKA